MKSYKSHPDELSLKGGLNAMCDVMEKYTKEAVERGREEERLKNIKFMIECGVDPAIIATKFDMSLDEILQLAPNESSK